MNGQDAASALPCFIGLLFAIISVAISIAIITVWLWALIHAATNKMENQAVWILVIILGGPIGAVAYFIARPYKRRLE